MGASQNLSLPNCINGNYDRFYYYAISTVPCIPATNCNYDQLILEFWKEEEGANSGWVHCSFVEGSNSETFTWDEGSTIPTINIDANKTYQVSFYAYDASDSNDVENVTTEIIEEADEHYIFYELAGISNLAIQSATNDISGSDGVPININTDWITGDAESGTVRVYLIHGPTSKSGSTRAQFGGGTDVEVNFPISIQ